MLVHLDYLSLILTGCNAAQFCRNDMSAVGNVMDDERGPQARLYMNVLERSNRWDAS